MSVRIFVKFRTRQVLCDPSKKLKSVADAACLALLGREFDYQMDFIHSQGEIYNENSPCHIVIDCDYLHAPQTLKDVQLHCFAVEDNRQHSSLLFLRETNVHRGKIDIVPWGRHSS
ncbi:hypothetical protein P154DRAFT_527404 [Amniculicola lignicola CBS 123094]|uniref:Uncharacterized protein n=1 Tax=Amniculicola lignicola CBS 123094 TaxID=1392246 RepID=A0A6A5VZ63_9PLEO|nr:hypothetical protein P154DRAFT_527404 [Amniculicola lignicola CBS 123094]